MFEFFLFIISIIAAAIAAIAGFGIGSLITPALSLSIDAKLAIVIVAIPHAVATALRFWMLRSHLDRKVFLHFGIASAFGGLTGALLHSYFSAPSIHLIFGIILMGAGFLGVTGWVQKWRIKGPVAWVVGVLSGVFGGLVGNQGGIRSAALLGTGVSKEAFVATATAAGLIVDAFRIPVYLWGEGRALSEHALWVSISVAGVVVGTLMGRNLLKLFPESTFKKTVSALIFLLGLWLLSQSDVV